MNSITKKIGNISIYDVRKAARSAQNSLFASNIPIEQLIRSATNTDTWGPSTKQLEEIHEQAQIEDYEDVVEVIFHRIAEYLEGPLTRRKQSLYNKAVHYVNSRNEWRIISKSLKVVEYLILQMDDEFVSSVQRHQGVLKRIMDIYDGEDAGIEDDITAAGLERKEHYKLITKSVEEISKLLKDDSYRNSQVAKAMRTSHLGSAGNNAIIVKGKEKASKRGFKVKSMTSTKVQNSNTKDEIRNHLGHVIHTNKSLPGKYEEFSGENNLLDGFDTDYSYDNAFDDNEQYDQPYDDFGEFHESGFKDKVSSDEDSKLPNVDTSGGPENDDENDDFGDFQTSPKTPQTSSNTVSKDQNSVLLSLDEPNTPTNPTTSTFDPFFTALSSPTSSKPSTGHFKDQQTPKTNDTFADLFKNAKGTS